MKALVIEDDFEHMKIVRRGLDEAGFLCDAAKTGAQARDMLAGGGYDVVVLDRMLPDVDGLDVLREIRAIVAYYGGDIDCKSNPGRGTVFTVTLPKLK